MISFRSRSNVNCRFCIWKKNSLNDKKSECVVACARLKDESLIRYFIDFCDRWNFTLQSFHVLLLLLFRASLKREEKKTKQKPLSLLAMFLDSRGEITTNKLTQKEQRKCGTWTGATFCRKPKTGDYCRISINFLFDPALREYFQREMLLNREFQTH